MELEKAKEYLRNLIKNEDTMDEVKALSYFYGVKAIETALQELERLQKENEELKAKQVMQEFQIDWCEKNTIKKCKIKAIFSTYEARREQGEPVIGYYTLKEFVKKILEEK